MNSGELATRRLLRAVRTPYALERDRLARRLAGALGSPSARDAVLSVSRRALTGFEPIFNEVVERLYVDGRPAKIVAGELHFSTRQVHRYRAAAVKLIARKVEEIAGSIPTSHPGERRCPLCGL